ncbi:hypothetical protein D3C71_2058230 [compost metagenome]
MAIWLKLNKNSEVTKLYELTRRDRLLISNINEKQNALRFGFASLNEKELTEAVEIIEKCLKLITAD